MSWDKTAFKEKIESQHTFPGVYLFKFIVSQDKKDSVLKLLPEGDISFRNSTNNAYISITLKARMRESREVIEVYEKLYQIKGIVAL